MSALRNLLVLAAITAGAVVPARGQDPANPGRDAFRAEKAIEVGQFYLKKGNYDAAIERFREAIRHRPAYARPYLLLGQAYEKKGEPEDAIGLYERYLELAPHGPDAEKVRKTIESLRRKLEGKKNQGKSKS